MMNEVQHNQQGLDIDGRPISLAQLHALMRHNGDVRLGANAIEKIEAAQQTVTNILQTDRAVYGINTGFGLLAQTRIPADQLSLLQENLILSHAAGLGDWLDDQVVRLMMILKVISLSQGFSGVRLTVVEHLVACINAHFHPCIPAKGSVGASGDLAPLAHMSLALMGEGQVLLDDQVLPAAKALETIGLKPLTLGPKEGLALINGTQASTALALMGLFAAEECFAAGLVAGGLSVDALMGSLKPFDPRIHLARGQKGQIMVAKVLRELLADSGIVTSHAHCQRVQDPYSLRCQPQVMGACWDSIRHTTEILRIEANAVTDNPLIFSDDQEVISGGNFHAEPVALAADGLALAIAEIGAISERRIAQLVDPKLSGLPAFLVENSGLNSGFMIAQVTAAALASENKSLAHPASVDSLPTSANQEDHVSMATYAARRLLDMAENTAGILAVEFLSAAQGIDFRTPLKTSPILSQVMTVLREQVPHYTADRYMAPDMAKIKNLIMNGTFLQWTRDYMFAKS